MFSLKKDMGTKIHWTAFRSVLDVRNHYLACFCERFMLRLIPQPLRSSDLQLFEGQACPFRRNLCLNPHPREKELAGGHNVHTLEIRKSVDSDQILVRKCQESLAERKKMSENIFLWRKMFLKFQDVDVKSQIFKIFKISKKIFFSKSFFKRFSKFENKTSPIF